MMLRLLTALCSVAVLAALLYFQRPTGEGAEGPAGDYGAAAPGYAAVHASLIETGEDGLPRYRLQADRIEQPQPQGTLYLAQPRLDYRLASGNDWTLIAQRGEMPQDARTADLSGRVHAAGLPAGSDAPMQIDTEQLHLDMTQEVATSRAVVRVDWAGNRLTGQGMRADLRNDRLQMDSKVHGVLLH